MWPQASPVPLMGTLEADQGRGVGSEEAAGGDRELLKTAEPSSCCFLPGRAAPTPAPCPVGQCPDHTPECRRSAGGRPRPRPACLSPRVDGTPRVPLHSQTRPGCTWALPQTTCPVNHTPHPRCLSSYTSTPGCWHPGQTPGREGALGHSSHKGRTRLPCGPLGTGPVEPTAAPVLQQCHVHTSPQHAS